MLIPNNTSRNPALAVGASTTTVAGLLSLLLVVFPHALTEQQITAIAVVGAFVLPLITAALTRGKVWSPASVQATVDEAIVNATTNFKIPLPRKNVD